MTKIPFKGLAGSKLSDFIHEHLDRSYCSILYLEEILGNHYALDYVPELKKDYEKVSEALNDYYQIVGKVWAKQLKVEDESK